MKYEAADNRIVSAVIFCKVLQAMHCNLQSMHCKPDGFCKLYIAMSPDKPQSCEHGTMSIDGNSDTNDRRSYRAVQNARRPPE